MGRWNRKTRRRKKREKERHETAQSSQNRQILEAVENVLKTVQQVVPQDELIHRMQEGASTAPAIENQKIKTAQDETGRSAIRDDQTNVASVTPRLTDQTRIKKEGHEGERGMLSEKSVENASQQSQESTDQNIEGAKLGTEVGPSNGEIENRSEEAEPPKEAPQGGVGNLAGGALPNARPNFAKRIWKLSMNFLGILGKGVKNANKKVQERKKNKETSGIVKESPDSLRRLESVAQIIAALAAIIITCTAVCQMNETNQLIGNIKQITNAIHNMAGVVLSTYNPEISVELTMTSSLPSAEAHQDTGLIFFARDWMNVGRSSEFYITVENTGRNRLDTLEIIFIASGFREFIGRAFRSDSMTVLFPMGLSAGRKSEEIRISDQIQTLLISLENKYPKREFSQPELVKINLAIGDAAAKAFGKTLFITNKVNFINNQSTE